MMLLIRHGEKNPKPNDKQQRSPIGRGLNRRLIDASGIDLVEYKGLGSMVVDFRVWVELWLVIRCCVRIGFKPLDWCVAGLDGGDCSMRIFVVF